MEKTNVPAHIRKLIGQAYIYALAGDPWNRINYTGALLSLLENAVSLTTKDRLDLLLISEQRRTWGEALQNYEREEFWGHAVWLCGEVVGKIGHLATEKYGEVPQSGFSILTATQATVKKQEG